MGNGNVIGSPSSLSTTLWPFRRSNHADSFKHLLSQPLEDRLKEIVQHPDLCQLFVTYVFSYDWVPALLEQSTGTPFLSASQGADDLVYQLYGDELFTVVATYKQKLRHRQRASFMSVTDDDMSHDISMPPPKLTLMNRFASAIAPARKMLALHTFHIGSVYQQESFALLFVAMLLPFFYESPIYQDWQVQQQGVSLFAAMRSDPRLLLLPKASQRDLGGSNHALTKPLILDNLPDLSASTHTNRKRSSITTAPLSPTPLADHSHASFLDHSGVTASDPHLATDEPTTQPTGTAVSQRVSDKSATDSAGLSSSLPPVGHVSSTSSHLFAADASLDQPLDADRRRPSTRKKPLPLTTSSVSAFSILSPASLSRRLFASTSMTTTRRRRVGVDGAYDVGGDGPDDGDAAGGDAGGATHRDGSLFSSFSLASWSSLLSRSPVRLFYASSSSASSPFDESSRWFFASSRSAYHVAGDDGSVSGHSASHRQLRHALSTWSRSDSKGHAASTSSSAAASLPVAVAEAAARSAVSSAEAVMLAHMRSVEQAQHVAFVGLVEDVLVAQFAPAHTVGIALRSRCNTSGSGASEDDVASAASNSLPVHSATAIASACFGGAGPAPSPAVGLRKRIFDGEPLQIPATATATAPMRPPSTTTPAMAMASDKLLRLLLNGGGAAPATGPSRSLGHAGGSPAALTQTLWALLESLPVSVTIARATVPSTTSNTPTHHNAASPSSTATSAAVAVYDNDVASSRRGGGALHDDDTFPLLYVNRAFEKLTGYGRDEVLGRNCRFLQSEECTEMGQVEQLQHALRERHACCKVAITNKRKNGSVFRNLLALKPIYARGVGSGSGEMVYVLGLQCPLTEEDEDASTSMIDDDGDGGSVATGTRSGRYRGRSLSGDDDDDAAAIDRRDGGDATWRRVLRFGYRGAASSASSTSTSPSGLRSKRSTPDKPPPGAYGAASSSTTSTPVTSPHAADHHRRRDTTILMKSSLAASGPAHRRHSSVTATAGGPATPPGPRRQSLQAVDYYDDDHLHHGGGGDAATHHERHTTWELQQQAYDRARWRVLSEKLELIDDLLRILPLVLV